jgi:hypothetical protein
MRKLLLEMRKVDHGVIASSLILDTSLLATTLGEGKLDTGFWSAIILLGCAEIRTGWCSRNPECRWPMSIYFSYMVVPGFLRTLVLVRRCDGVQFASRMVSPSRDMSR